MSKVPILGANGNGPQIPDEVVEQIAANYGAYAAQLGAVNTLISAMPLPVLLAANERLQTRAALTMPLDASPEQAAAVSLALRNDGKVIKAAMQYVRVLMAAQTGQI